MIKQALGLDDSHLFVLKNNLDNNQRLHKAIEADYRALIASANEAGYNLQVASGYRDFNRQSMIWNNKFTGQRPVQALNGKVIDIESKFGFDKLASILTFSALPGLSRHHWGSDFDYYDASTIAPEYQLQLESHEYQSGGPFSGLSDWLDNNAKRFGFFKPYAVYQGGVASEPWHLSHIKIASQYESTIKNLTKDEFFKILNDHKVQGTDIISEHFDTILQQYVFNIVEPS